MEVYNPPRVRNHPISDEEVGKEKKTTHRKVLCVGKSSWQASSIGFLSEDRTWRTKKHI